MYSHPHNEMLYWLVETGLVSVIGMLCFAVVSILQLVRVGCQRGLAYFGMIFPISLHVIVELPFYQSSLHWFTWLFLLYLIHSHGQRTYHSTMNLYKRRVVQAVTAGTVLIVGTLFLHTEYALGRLVDFLKSGGKDLQALETVNKNPVLNEMGVFLTTRLFLYSDISSNQTANAVNFIKWAERHSVDFPEPGLFADLALAYGYLGDDENARRVIDKAISIYSRNEMLLKRKQHVYAGTIVELFEDTQVRKNDGSE
jgi:O-antigen polymerase